MHLVLRTLNWFIYIWLTIIIGEYAKLACINPGIIYGCLSSAIIFNSLFTYFIFGEKITFKMCIGISIVIAGVVWISVAKNTGDASEFPEAVGLSD